MSVREDGGERASEPASEREERETETETARQTDRDREQERQPIELLCLAVGWSQYNANNTVQAFCHKFVSKTGPLRKNGGPS